MTYEPSDKELYGMSDSDWATRHSTTGWVFIMNQAALSWGSKKQPSVALSSCEAEIKLRDAIMNIGSSTRSSPAMRLRGGVLRTGTVPVLQLSLRGE